MSEEATFRLNATLAAIDYIHATQDGDVRRQAEITEATPDDVVLVALVEMYLAVLSVHRDPNDYLADLATYTTDLRDYLAPRKDSDR